jgi:hypothetical protein
MIDAQMLQKIIPPGGFRYHWCCVKMMPSVNTLNPIKGKRRSVWGSRSAFFFVLR